MDSLNKKIIHLSVPVFILHFIEEWYLFFYKVDPSITFLSQYIGVNKSTTFLLIQLTLFLLLGAFLFLIILHKNINYGGFIVGAILIFEISHVFYAIVLKSYYPGFISGVILTSLGVWYWYKLLQIQFIK